MTHQPRRFALIPAAGTGLRFGGSMPKQYVPIAGRPLLAHTIAALNESIVLEAVFVVLAKDDRFYTDQIGAIPGVVPVFEGGRTRAESVKNGLAAIGKFAHPEDWVLVHDAVRPCIDVGTLNRLLNELEDEPVGGLLAIPLGDALKRGETVAGLRVASSESCESLWCAQSPQMFRYAILNHALRQADLSRTVDESQAVEALGVKPRLVQGSPANIKVTHFEHVGLAEAILAARAKAYAA